MRTLIVVALVALATPLAGQDRQVLHGPGEVRGLPFSSPVRVGNLLFLPGQIGNVPGSRQLADTGIAGQTRQALETVKAVLAAAGSSLDRAVKCTVFLADIKDYAAMNAVCDVFPAGSPRALHGGGERAGVGGAGGDRVCGVAGG